MFENIPDYPRAVTAASGPDRTAVQLAVEWLRRTADDVGGRPLVYGPDRRGLREWPILTGLDGWAVVATWRSFGTWSGGPVLAAWPNAEHLAEIADDPRTRALCVVPWLDAEVAPWVQAYSPVTLPTTLALAEVEPAIIPDPVAVEGLRTLTDLVNVTSLHASAGDRPRAVEVLRTLHGGGHVVDPEGARTWAMAHGWSARAAGQLADLARQIASGKRLRTGRPLVLREGILETWRRDAGV